MLPLTFTHPPIIRGEYSSELKYTKANRPYVHTQLMPTFDGVNHVRIRSLFIFPSHKGNYFVVRVITLVSKESKRDASRLVTFTCKPLTYRVNLDSGAITQLFHRCQVSVTESADTFQTPDQFKNFLLHETGLAKSLITLGK
jgi:hypothetical protein